MHVARCLRRAACVCLPALAFLHAFAAGSDPELVPTVVAMLADADPEVRAIALDRVRHGAKGEAATSQFAGTIAKLPAAQQVALVGALAERGDSAAVPAITALLLAAKEPAVRVASIRAIGALGSAGETPILIRSLSAGDPDRSAARFALTALRGDGATKQIVEAARLSAPGLRPVFLDILVDRRARSALPDFVAMAVDADAGVRQAAMRALGKLGGPEQVDGLVKGLLATPAGEERAAAERAVVAVCTQNPGKEKAAAAFLSRFEASPEADRESLLPTLGRVGGPGALAIIDRLVADADSAKRQFGLKALTRWPDATVADRILGLLGKSQDAAEREMLLAALIRIAPLPDNKLSDQQKLALLKKTMGLCQKNEDRARVLERANAIRTIETFRFVLPYLDDPALAEPACKSVVELAHHQKLRDSSKDEFAKALDKVISLTKDAELVERANRYKEGKTWERKKG
jgi:HEAT repeat protein